MNIFFILILARLLHRVKMSGYKINKNGKVCQTALECLRYEKYTKENHYYIVKDNNFTSDGQKRRKIANSEEELSYEEFGKLLNGVLLTKYTYCEYVNGKRNGLFKEYSNNNVLYSAEFYHENKRNGPRIIFHMNNKPHIYEHYNNDKLEGCRYVFDKKGKIVIEEQFFKDVLHGPQFYYNDKLYKEANYCMGFLHGVQICYFPNGAISSKNNYCMGRLHGTSEIYNGKSIFHSIEYFRGNRHGPTKRYYSNGQVKIEETYHHDLINKKKLYDYYGNLIDTEEYVMGIKL